MSSETLRVEGQRPKKRENCKLSTFTPGPEIFALGFLVGDSSRDKKRKMQNENDFGEGESDWTPFE